MRVKRVLAAGSATATALAVLIAACGDRTAVLFDEPGDAAVDRTRNDTRADVEVRRRVLPVLADDG